MPRRGPPPKAESSHDEGFAAQGLGSGRSAEFFLETQAFERPFNFFSLVVQPVDRKTAEFSLVVHPVKRVLSSFEIVTNAVSVVGSTIESEAMRLVTRAVAPTGYPSPPRLSSFRAIPIGPVVRRRAEVIPPAE